MKLSNFIKPLLTSIITIVVILTVASIVDIILSVISARFYSTAAFITIFGVAGFFAAVLAYSYSIKQFPEKTNTARWALIITYLIIGALFFFVFAVLESGEYEVPFKAFGITLALGSFLFAKGNPDL